MGVIVGWRGSDKQSAGANSMNRFETEVPTRKENLQGLIQLNAH